jgi:hypothetical protein
MQLIGSLFAQLYSENNNIWKEKNKVVKKGEDI